MLRQKWMIILVSLLAVIGLGLAYYFYAHPVDSSKREAGKVIAQVSKLIILPTDETPTVATISEPDLLKDQPFFSQTQKGDQILIYAKAKKAYLFRPSVNKLVEVSTIAANETPSKK